MAKKVVALCIALTWLHLVASSSIGWQQDSPPLTLAVSADPPVAETGQVVVLTITVTNTSDGPLAQVQVQIDIPEQTVMEGANVGGENWAVSTPGRGERGTVIYSGRLAAGESRQLELWVAVQQEHGKTIVLDAYSATVMGMQAPINGAPFTVWVGTTPTPVPPASPTATATPTAMPTSTATSTPTATPMTTPTATSTVTPSPTLSQTPAPTPSPTITVVMADLPPTELPPTATPNLSTEQVQLGTLTVSIFIVMTLILVVISVVWMVRRGKGQKRK